MDVIAMQAVNKVLRKMNTEFGGMYEFILAKEGQDTFTTTKSFSMNNDHTLKVFVEGVIAIEGKDYNKVDANNIKFVSTLHENEVVLFITDVAGVIKFSNPGYDDSIIKNEITNITNTIKLVQEAIDTIKLALDENGDGIIETLTQIKTQWEGADNSLKALIDDKVSKSIVDAIEAEITNARSGKTTLLERLNEIIATIPKEYNDVQIKSDVKTVSDEVSAARNGKATLLEELQDLSAKIQDIVTALDDDKDGSIIDTIANIKTQWENADSSLQSLINNKAETSSVTTLSDELSSAREGKTTLKEKLDTIIESISGPYNDTTIKNDIKTISDEITAARNSKANLKEELDTIVGSIPSPYDDTSIKNRVQILEGKTISFNDLTTKDSVTNYEYKIAITNSIVTAVLTDNGKVSKCSDDLTIGDTTAVVDKLTLPTTIDDCTITWTTNNSTVIATDGTVARPTHGSGNSIVILTATIKSNTTTKAKDFTVTVLEQTA